MDAYLLLSIFFNFTETCLFLFVVVVVVAWKQHSLYMRNYAHISAYYMV